MSADLYYYQQMKSTCSFQLEDSVERSSLNDDGLPSSAPSNAVANYNHIQPNLLSHERSRIVNESLFTDTYTFSSMVRYTVHSDNALDSLNNTDSSSVVVLVQYTVHSEYDLDFDERSTFGVEDFSQSFACIATRFGECSSTLLDKLWYLYLYIYSTTTIILLLFIVAILMPPTT